MFIIERLNFWMIEVDSLFGVNIIVFILEFLYAFVCSIKADFERVFEDSIGFLVIAVKLCGVINIEFYKYYNDIFIWPS